MNWSALAITAAATVTTAVVGNLFIPKTALAWFRGLRRPRWLVPYPVFIAVGISYYALTATVLYRAVDRDDIAAALWVAVVMVANEGWNAVFFGLRSTLGGFVAILTFAALLAAPLIHSREDGLSLVLLAAYAGWVAYDIAWTFALWRLNRH